MNARSYGLTENEVEEAGHLAAQIIEQEIKKTEEAAQHTRNKAKEAAKQAQDAAKCANHSRAAIKKAGEDAMWNFPGQVGVLRCPKAFKEENDNEGEDNDVESNEEDNNDDNRLVNLTLEEQTAYQRWSSTVIKLHKLREEVASSFFRNLPQLRTKKQRYTFNPSIMTDGVSVSLQFSKTIHITPQLSKGDKVINKVSLKKLEDDTKRKELISIITTPSNNEDITALGVDPGRTCLSTVVLIDKNQNWHEWRLARGQYLSESGIRKATKLRAQRYAKHAKLFQELSESNDDNNEEEGEESDNELKVTPSNLRTSHSQTVLNYLVNYLPHAQDWWQTAFQRRERRDKFAAYGNKRSVLGSFASKVLREARSVVGKDTKVVIAYGSAGPKMSVTGKGEAAVPTTGMYQAFKRVCHLKKNKTELMLVDEYNTAKVDWDTALPKLKVYRAAEWKDIESTSTSKHLSLKAIPFTGKSASLVPDEHKEAVKQMVAKNQVKNKVRRGGAINNLVQEKNNNQQLRYPEVRGLQFCPEKKKFVSRDKASAGAISRLAVMQLSGWARPAAWCPRQQCRLVIPEIQIHSETRVESPC